MNYYPAPELLDDAVRQNYRKKVCQKIIFLDVDGVLHDFSDDAIVQEERVILLKQIADATDAEIVLSSSWRMGFPQFLKENHLLEYLTSHESESLNQLQAMMQKYDLHIADFTPYSNLGENGRPLEIRRFLLDKPCTKSFVILDDDDFNWQWLRGFLVQTKTPDGTRADGSLKFRYGLEEEHVSRAVAILNQFD